MKVCPRCRVVDMIYVFEQKSILKGRGYYYCEACDVMYEYVYPNVYAIPASEGKLSASQASCDVSWEDSYGFGMREAWEYLKRKEYVYDGEWVSKW